MSRALKVVPPARSAAREELAAAIAKAAPIRAEVDEVRARAEAARGALASAREAVPAAERAVEAAKVGLVSNPSADRGELRRLRAVVADCVDDLEIAKGVVDRIEADLVQVERSVRYSFEKVETAANLVLRSAFEPALAAAERAGLRFARLAFAARVIADSGNGSDGERTRLALTADALNPQAVFRSNGAAATAARQDAQAPWLLAQQTLLTDPDAALPTIE